MISSLSQRVIWGFIRLNWFCAILLFLPAGSIDSGGMACTGVYSVAPCYSSHGISLKVESRLCGTADAGRPWCESSNTQQVVQLMSGVLACALFLVQVRPSPAGVRSPASIVLVADGLLVFSAMGITFRAVFPYSYAAGTVRVGSEQQVVSNGPYATVRHPLYVASILGFLATPFALARFGHSPFGILLCAVVVVRLLDEERFLLNTWGMYTTGRHVKYRLIPVYLW